MARVDVNKPFDLHGEFWAAGKDEKTAPGRLFRTADDGIGIQLFRDLRPEPSHVPADVNGTDTGWYEVVPSPERDKPFTIHGVLGGVGRVTAIDCQALRGSMPMLGGPQEHLLSPLNVVLGAQTEGRGQRFCGVRVRLRNIDEWADLGGFAIVMEETGARSISFEEPTVEPVRLASGAQLSLHQETTLRGPTVRGGAFNRKVWLQVINLKPATWQEIDSAIATPLVSLVTLCLGVRSGATEIELTIDGERWLQLGANWLESEEPDRIDAAIAWLAHLGLPGVAHWLDKVEELGPLPPVVARFSAKQKSTVLETELLEMTTVAEGLHSRLFPDQVRVSDAQAARIQTKVMDVLSDEEQPIQQILRGMMTHLKEPGYGRRLKQLAGLVEASVPGIVGRTNKWAEAVTNARNKYAHRTGGFLQDSDIDSLFAVVESLRWLLRCILVLQAGVSDEHLAKRVSELSGYGLFLERAATGLPKVYTRTESQSTD